MYIMLQLYTYGDTPICLQYSSKNPADYNEPEPDVLHEQSQEPHFEVRLESLI